MLLKTHAFEELGMGRVQWKTDHRNQRSQDAIARLGAQREGVPRRHKQRPDGTWRDTVYVVTVGWRTMRVCLSAASAGPFDSAPGTERGQQWKRG